MKKHGLTVAALLLTTTICAATDDAAWMRNCAISPDGQRIAFTYQGDIFTVPIEGGRASQLTTNPAYDSYPVWSPDGKYIAFSSNRLGGKDVFIVDSEGGSPKRLTTHSTSETPIAFLDNEHILYSANIMPDADDRQFASPVFPQVYQVSIKGGRPKLFSSMTMENISINPSGKSFLYHDVKGYEDPWRKHHTSSITRDIWLTNVDGNRSYKKLSSFKGEDRNPVWADKENYYYLSEEKGTFNVFKANINDTKTKQLTHHTKHPVRFLSVAKNGTICYAYDGNIYTMKEGKRPQKVAIDIVNDKLDRDVIKQMMNSGATEFAMSSTGKEIAFILRGDVYVTSKEYKTTKQITNTPEQERSIDFAPDGRGLVYASERDGMWQIYQTRLVDPAEKMFTYATNIKEEQLTHSKKTSFQPKYSPDGKEVAFLEDRTTLRVLNLKKKSVRTVMDGQFEFSYADGDQYFEWSPDSKWLLTNYIGKGGWNNRDIALVNASGNGEIHNLTESGYNDTNAKWVLGGKAMIWKSDRAGFRSHGSWGAEHDIYMMFFDLEAYERFRMNKEDMMLADEAEKAEKEAARKEEMEKQKKNKKDKKDKNDKKEEAKKAEEKLLKFDLENRMDRIVRLTVHSSMLGDAVLNAKGDKLYYQAAFEGGPDLWEQNLKEGHTRLVMKNIGWGDMYLDNNTNELYLCAGGGIRKVKTMDGRGGTIAFDAPYEYRPAAEREYIFDHVWQQVKDKFYKPDLHQVDWEGYRQAYRRFLPSINNNYDFQDLLSELLGELNASHTGARYNARPKCLPTANLGVFFDQNFDGDGLKIKEILAKSPFSVQKNDVTSGCIIEKIEGVELKKDMDYFPLLEGKVGKKVRLGIYNPSTRKHFEVSVRAIHDGQLNNLLYHRWVERNKKDVEELSGGRLAYVHVRNMDSDSFRAVYSQLLNEKNRQKDAVIVDTRHNGGGWLHEDLVTLLTGEEYQQFRPRGRFIGSDPFNRWLKPSCVLVCEDNYSNAHGFPWVYQELKIGKLIGAPVPGTMTAVWWENQIDPSMVFGIPQVGCVDREGNYGENRLLVPDIEVYNKPEQSLDGHDEQLATAVREMLKTVK